MALNSMVGAAIGVVLLAIIIFSVALPIIQQSIASANLTGTNATIANLIPTFLILGLFVIVVGLFVIRWI